MLNFFDVKDDVLLQTPSVDAALYFLNSGHYLFRWKENAGTYGKCVAAPDMAAAFTQRNIDTGWLETGVVRAGYSKVGDWYVYFTPGQMKTIQIEKGKTVSSLTIPIPSTIMLGAGRDYYIWATATTTFKPRDNVFQAPFPNVDSNGKICFGKNAPPDAHHSRAKAIWELFFGSPFNGDLAQDKSKAHKEDALKQLETLEGMQSYPAGDLVDAGSDIGYLVERMLRNIC